MGSTIKFENNESSLALFVSLFLRRKDQSSDQTALVMKRAGLRGLIEKRRDQTQRSERRTK